MIETPEAREAPPSQDHDEPRARDVVASRIAPTLDPSRRWEAARYRDFTLPRLVRTEMELRLDPASWQRRSLEIREREIPPELVSDLRRAVPQALLRDLHRPVREFYPQREVIEGSLGLGAWEDAAEAIRAARILPARADVGSSLHAVRDRQRERREFLTDPWQPIFDDAAPRRTIKLWPGDWDA